jgi:hypothetical protein
MRRQRSKKVKKIIAVMASAAIVLASAAQATVINFVAEANTGGERGVADGTALNTAALGGLNLAFSGGRGGSAADFAYFNAPGGRRLGGLGTCTTLDPMMQCVDPTDDTVAHAENVRVDFLDGPFEIRRLSFNGRFAALDGSPLLLKITTSLSGVVSEFLISFADASRRNFGFVDWVRFEFVQGQGNVAKFFVASISDVPLPGALPLLLSGLAGIGFAARRRRA